MLYLYKLVFDFLKETENSVCESPCFICKCTLSKYLMGRNIHQSAKICTDLVTKPDGSAFPKSVCFNRIASSWH